MRNYRNIEKKNFLFIPETGIIITSIRHMSYTRILASDVDRYDNSHDTIDSNVTSDISEKDELLKNIAENSKQCEEIANRLRERRELSPILHDKCREFLDRYEESHGDTSKFLGYAYVAIAEQAKNSEVRDFYGEMHDYEFLKEKEFTDLIEPRQYDAMLNQAANEKNIKEEDKPLIYSHKQKLNELMEEHSKDYKNLDKLLKERDNLKEKLAETENILIDQVDIPEEISIAYDHYYTSPEDIQVDPNMTASFDDYEALNEFLKNFFLKKENSESPESTVRPDNPSSSSSEFFPDLNSNSTQSEPDPDTGNFFDTHSDRDTQSDPGIQSSSNQKFGVGREDLYADSSKRQDNSKDIDSKHSNNSESGSSTSSDDTTKSIGSTTRIGIHTELWKSTFESKDILENKGESSSEGKEKSLIDDYADPSTEMPDVCGDDD